MSVKKLGFSVFKNKNSKVLDIQRERERERERERDFHQKFLRSNFEIYYLEDSLYLDIIFCARRERANIESGTAEKLRDRVGKSLFSRCVFRS